MVRSTRALCEARLGRADVELSIDGYRVAIDDLSMELFSESQRQSSFSAGRGSKNDYQERRDTLTLFETHVQRRLQ
jgi:hypothetical protein